MPLLVMEVTVRQVGNGGEDGGGSDDAAVWRENISGMNSANPCEVWLVDCRHLRSREHPREEVDRTGP